MENLGDRLKEERERLGFSQAKFADACGVGKTAQFNYESNARMPDGHYLYKAGELGVDTGYLLFSERSTANSLFALAASNVLHFVTEKAGINGDALMWILNQAAESESNHWNGKGAGTNLDISQDDIIYLVDELFSSGDLLYSVVMKVRTCLHMSNISLPADKEYALIMMLFRSFKSSGNIDMVMVEDAVKLASS